MKPTHLIGFTSLAIAVTAGAQSDEGGKSKHHGAWKWLQILSGDEQAKYRAARKAALQDSDVHAADEKRR